MIKLNSFFINDGLSQSIRLERLNKIVISQMQILNNSDTIMLENNLDKTLCNNCIYGVLDIPKPLDKNLIEIDNFNHVFNDDKVRNRLKMYKKK